MDIVSLYSDYVTLVYNLALQYVQNIEDAEEITQDVFVAIHQNIHDFNHQSNIKTWIYRITINKSLDFIKAKKRKKRFAFLVSIFGIEENVIKHNISDFNHPGVILEQKEALEIIFCAINLLPQSQKTAIILNKIESKSQKEIAEIMQISSKAVESLVQRAKTNLKNSLDKTKYSQQEIVQVKTQINVIL